MRGVKRHMLLTINENLENGTKNRNASSEGEVNCGLVIHELCEE